MNKDSIKIYRIDEEREKRIWQNSIFVFDTSALLDFYFYPKETRDQIFSQLFKTLEGKFWIPAHVEFEYLKNRESQISKPIVEKYEPLKEKQLTDLAEYNRKIKSTAESIKKDTFKPDSHPYLPQDKIDKFIDFLKLLDEKTKKFAEDIESLIMEQEAEITSLQKSDSILKTIEKYFDVGTPTPFDEVMKIVKEGKLRYEFNIPPGYMDVKEKQGTQIFGDLIIWKQILEYSKEVKSNVIFICNDLKLDWCYKDSRNRITCPREELIKEFNDNNGKEFWMYNQAQFLYKANEILKTEIEAEKIEEIKKVISERNNQDLEFECSECGSKNEINFDLVFLEFENTHSEIVEENVEVQIFQADHECKCQYCKYHFRFDYLVAIEPDGSIYQTNMGISDGVILQEPDFANRFLAGDYENYYSLDDGPDLDFIRNR